MRRPVQHCGSQVADVQAYAQQLNAKNFRNARPAVQRQSWGWDDMSINDPNGNKLMFCTPNAF